MTTDLTSAPRLASCQLIFCLDIRFQTSASSDLSTQSYLSPADSPARQRGHLHHRASLKYHQTCRRCCCNVWKVSMSERDWRMTNWTDTTSARAVMSREMKSHSALGT